MVTAALGLLAFSTIALLAAVLVQAAALRKANLTNRNLSASLDQSTLAVKEMIALHEAHQEISAIVSDPEVAKLAAIIKVKSARLH